MKTNFGLLLILCVFVICVCFITYLPTLHSSKHDTYDCLPDTSIGNKKELLPEVDIFLRMFSKGRSYYDELLVPSMKYFWPGNLSMVIVLDGESQTDRELGPILTKNYPFPRICFQGPADPAIYHYLGHQRMQRDFFYPERFTRREYVGYLDTDTVFITRVTRELLFEENKPVVIGVFGPASDSFWSESSEITEKLFKTKEVMKCMSYFPIIIKVKHVVMLRTYLEVIHGTTFANVFKSYANLPIAQFNLMCQYIWMFHRDEYIFYFNQRRTEENLVWRGERNSPGRVGYLYYNNVLSPEQRFPKPRTSIHYRYATNWKKLETLHWVLKEGLCFSGGIHVCADFCADIDTTHLQETLFHFEASDWRWDSRCMQSQVRHYNIVNSIYMDENMKAVIRTGCQEVIYLKLTINEHDI